MDKQISNIGIITAFLHSFGMRDPVRTKIVIDKIIEQVNMFNYLGNMISYEKKIGH